MTRPSGMGQRVRAARGPNACERDPAAVGDVPLADDSCGRNGRPRPPQMATMPRSMTLVGASARSGAERAVLQLPWLDFATLLHSRRPGAK
jgi:hypothetical protein